MKTAGIIGGMGPGTTADFYKGVNQLSEQRGEAVRPGMMIWNVQLPYAIEQDLLLNQRGLDKYLPHLITGAQALERAGSDFLVVPCNTVHELYDQFRDSVDVPFLHIVKQTAELLKRRDVGQVALLATGQTVNSNLYQGFLAREGIDCVVPGDDDQARLNSIVAGLVTAEGAEQGRSGGEDSAWLNRLVDGYGQSVGSVVLGCTDFHIMLRESDPGVVVDSMQVLVGATTDAIYS
jgi:aspartate racemase